MTHDMNDTFGFYTFSRAGGLGHTSAYTRGNIYAISLRINKRIMSVSCRGELCTYYYDIEMDSIHSTLPQLSLSILKSCSVIVAFVHVFTRVSTIINNYINTIQHVREIRWRVCT